MKKPKPSLLHPDVIKALQTHPKFTSYPILLEFLGQMSGMARSINNSLNPVKAAMTMLNRDSNTIHLKTFLDRKRAKQNQPLPKMSEEVESLLDDYNDIKTGPVAEEEDWQPADFHKGAGYRDHENPDTDPDDE